MTKIRVLLSCLLLMAINCPAQWVFPAYYVRFPDKYTDPFIGTGGHGHTYPGATVPFGMVQLSPDNGTEGWDWCSGYNYGDSTIAGFSHMHLSGTGCGDWCDISVMPNIGLIPDTAQHFKVKFSHKNEVSRPGYYSVTLDNDIAVELTATERCGLHSYTFPEGSTPVLCFNLGFAINYDSCTQSSITKIDDYTIIGYRYSTGWANVQRVYFAARTNVPIKYLHKYYPANYKGKKTENGQLVFKDLHGKTLMMKVALSSTGTDQALNALNEIKGWDFTRVSGDAANKWAEELGKIRISTNDDRLKRTFYTALYHTCMAPVLYSDKEALIKTPIIK